MQGGLWRTHMGDTCSEYLLWVGDRPVHAHKVVFMSGFMRSYPLAGL